MRLLGYACGGVVALGLAAFGLQGRVGTEPVAAPFDIAVPELPGPTTPAASEPLRVAASSDGTSRATARSDRGTPLSAEAARVEDEDRSVGTVHESASRSATHDRESARSHRADIGGTAGSDGADARENAGVRESAQENARRSRWDDDDDRDDRRRWRRRYREPLPPPEAWEPPEGPVRIGLQAGHWRADEAPPELSGLRGNGTRGGGLDEWEANLAIARRAGAMLEELGYVVDILPAVVPPEYRAHLFISIHSDGSNDPRATGFRVAAPRRDATHRASGMVELLEGAYARATGLPRLPQVTRRMRNYYAFNSRRYEHALHPMTIGVILETGFLTSSGDRRVIVDDPDRPARGIVEAVKAFSVTPPPGVKAAVDGLERDGAGRER